MALSCGFPQKLMKLGYKIIGALLMASALLTGCNNGSSTDQQNGYKARPGDLPPMPGAKPFTPEKPPVPDKEALNKLFKEAAAKAERDAAENAKAEAAKAAAGDAKASKK